MFTAKKSTLQQKKPATIKSSANKFIKAAQTRSAETISGNGALKYSTTNNCFVDEFGACAAYKAPRTYEEISKSMSTMWATDKEMTVKFMMYLRMITRKVQLLDGSTTSTVQRGQGLKHEGILRAIWLAVEHPSVFWDNLSLFIAIGSWKDIITMLQYDLVYNGWEDKVLDWKKFGQVIISGLENESTSNLVKKYLPSIKSSSNNRTVEAQADTMIGKYISSLLFGQKLHETTSYSYKKYRLLKTSGTAHEWQKLISKGKLLDINFNTIHGRALAQLVSGKFLKNNKLEEKYQKWMETKPVLKYTGYVYELLSKISKSTHKYQLDTINKQFQMLVDTAKKGIDTNTSLIVVRDTSASMGSPADGTNISCGDIAKSLALFFSEMLPDGEFANSWIEFNSSAKFHTWKGSNVVEKWKNDRSNYVGSTNFQSVISLLCSIKRKGVHESEFPTGILCISDNEFDPTQLNETNVNTALKSLTNAGFSKDYVDNFKIVLWNLRNSYYGLKNKIKFETSDGSVKNVFYFSGLDGSVVSFLTGMKGQDAKLPSTAEELFQAAMDQEVMNLVTV